MVTMNTCIIAKDTKYFFGRIPNGLCFLFAFSDSQLGDYEYVQNCLKLDEDIKLVLVDLPHLERPLLRTAVDDRQAVLVPKHRDMEAEASKVTRWVQEPG